jgi:hypothetical protein
MLSRCNLRIAALFVAITFALSPVGRAEAQKAQSFASAEAAAEALNAATKAKNADAVVAIFGAAAREWLVSGDPVQDAADMERFSAAYQQKHGFERTNDGQTVLTIGNDNFPFPIPLVRSGGSWSFDAESGREELINRRVGRNELHAIQALLAVVDAQREYASANRDGSGIRQYAQKFRSDAGKRNGLYWPTKDGEPPSPLGPLVAGAVREGYAPGRGDAAVPYHGYLYRILAAQGPSAAGGTLSYVIGGRMIGGFAVLAYPARYDVSGIKSFLVNHDGVVYEKDLGPNTSNAADRITVFDPDSSWKKL